MTIPEFIGYTGVALLIITYAMLQLDKIDPKGFWYSFNNIITRLFPLPIRGTRGPGGGPLDSEGVYEMEHRRMQLVTIRPR